MARGNWCDLPFYVTKVFTHINGSQNAIVGVFVFINISANINSIFFPFASFVSEFRTSTTNEVTWFWLTVSLDVLDTQSWFGILPRETPFFFFLLTLKQRPYAILWTKPPRPVGQGHRWQGWRPHLASCAIGWWSVTSRLIERWLKSILCLAHREIMADKITTVLQEGNCTGHILQELSQGRKSGF